MVFYKRQKNISMNIAVFFLKKMVYNINLNIRVNLPWKTGGEND
ncbi:MAG: hypothetical protein QG657_1505 [Acidobacteriota bacterium]|nr:hypothetical protein [Acidobacteriota bacterium]